MRFFFYPPFGPVNAGMIGIFLSIFLYFFPAAAARRYRAAQSAQLFNLDAAGQKTEKERQPERVLVVSDVAHSLEI